VSGLPKGWEELPIGQVILPFRSTDPTKEPSKEFRYIDIGSIDNSCQAIADPKSFKGKDAPSRARRVVFSTVRTYLKNIATVPSELSGALTSTGIAVLRPSARMDSRYLFHWVASDAFISEISKSQDGTMYPAVSDRDVSSSRIAVPPLPEQHRIVVKLDSLTGRTARAREELGRIPRLIQKYREAILSAAFSGELTMEWRQKEGTKVAWTKRQVGQIISAIVAGKNLRCEERPPRENENGVVKVSAVTWGAFDPSAAKTLPSNFIPPERTKIRAGDFLISRANTLELVAAVVIVDRNPDNLFLSDKILRLEMEDKHKRWLLWFLRSSNGRNAIEESATGNQLSMRNLSQAALSKIVLPWPEEEERQEIVRRIEIAFDWLDRVATEHANASRLLPKLDQAILARAFRGELVLPDVQARTLAAAVS
jgi:type I restriction enzyme S subunit